MPPRVAGIFGGGSTRVKNPNVDKPIPVDEIESSGRFEDLVSEMVASDEQKLGPKRARYIYAAAEKAGERRVLMETLKANRLERELARIERDGEPVISTSPAESIEGKRSVKSSESQDSAVSYDFEAMKERYFARAEKKDILKLSASPEQLDMIVHWAELSHE